MAYQGPTGIFINNKFVKSVSGKEFPTINPSTGEVITKVAEGDEADVNLAVAAAETAFAKWKKTSPDRRSQLLNKLANLVQENIEHLAKVESLDNGMPYTIALSVLTTTALYYRFFHF